MSKPPKSRLPVDHEAAPRLERIHAPEVLPPEKTQRTNINVNVNAEAHLIIREVRKLIVALAIVTLLLGPMLF